MDDRRSKTASNMASCLSMRVVKAATEVAFVAAAAGTPCRGVLGQATLPPTLLSGREYFAHLFIGSLFISAGDAG